MDVSTQMPAPSNDSPIIDTVKLEITGKGPKCEPQAGVPVGTGGTIKFTWYKPAYPGVRPEKSGSSWGHFDVVEQSPGQEGGWVGAAFARNSKFNANVTLVATAGEGAGWPVTAEGRLLSGR